jgi:hypothetical protein
MGMNNEDEHLLARWKDGHSVGYENALDEFWNEVEEIIEDDDILQLVRDALDKKMEDYVPPTGEACG